MADRSYFRLYLEIGGELFDIESELLADMLDDGYDPDEIKGEDAAQVWAELSREIVSKIKEVHSAIGA